MKKRKSSNNVERPVHGKLKRIMFIGLLLVAFCPFISNGQKSPMVKIVGNKTLCLSDDQTYNVEPLYGGITYNWTIIPSNAGTITTNNNSNITVHWNQNNMNFSQPTSLIVTTDFGADTIHVWKCCKDANNNGTVISDQVITSNLSSGPYYLNGDITISGNVTFSNSVFYMGPEAKIIIDASNNQTINYSILQAGCNYMWDGIYVSNPNSPTINTSITTMSSTIRDAVNAIVSVNGGQVNASNTIFKLNLKGIIAIDARYSNPTVISNCKFYSSSDDFGSTMSNLIAPYSNRRGMTGIELFRINNADVGNTNKATKNKFKYLDYGIDISLSNVNVYNNNFENIIGTAGSGAGVRITGYNDANFSVNIGGYNTGSTIYTNLFNNCINGVYQQDQSNLKVICDTFSSSTFYATYIASNSNRSIDFTRNYIQNSPYGLLINDFANTRLIVDTNNLNNVSYGLTASNATQQECYGATFRKNNITGVFYTGIQLTNVLTRSTIVVGPPGHERQNPYIYGNTINFGSYNILINNMYSGINVTNGYYTCIEDNIVNTPTSTVGSETQGLRLNGIYVTASPRTSFCSNTLTNLGMGIRINGLCTASQLRGNSMNNNYYGVRLENATIGNQGVVPVRWVNRNSWSTPFVAGRYRVQGSLAAATTWTYDASPSNYTLLSNPAEYSVTGGLTTTSIALPVPQGCGYDGVIWVPYVFDGGGGGQTGGISNSIASQEIGLMQKFKLDTEENLYYQAANYYATTQKENMPISVDATDEITENPIQTTSIVQFDQVNRLISANRIDEAIALNDAIAPKNLIEKNHKIANAIYLQSWAKGRFELTDDERATLLQIATQPHIQGGYGVFTAWVMLNKMYYAEETNSTNETSQIGASKNNGTTIYPNPAREQVAVNGASEVAYAVVYDLQGRELMKTANVSASSLITINTSKLTKGVYFITLINKDLSIIKSEKLVIE